MTHAILSFSGGQPVRGVVITTTGFEGTYLLCENKQGINPQPATFTDNAQPTPTPVSGSLVEFPALTAAYVSFNCDASKLIADEYGSIYVFKIEPTA